MINAYFWHWKSQSFFLFFNSNFPVETAHHHDKHRMCATDHLLCHLRKEHTHSRRAWRLQYAAPPSKNQLRTAVSKRSVPVPSNLFIILHAKVLSESHQLRFILEEFHLSSPEKSKLLRLPLQKNPIKISFTETDYPGCQDLTLLLDLPVTWLSATKLLGM